MDNKFVFIIQEDKCIKNGCLENVPTLLDKLPKYGKIIPYDVAVQSERDEKQAVVDNLTAELAKLKAHNLSTSEIQVLNVLRTARAEENKAREAEWATERAQLVSDKQAETAKVETLKSEFNNYKRRIRSFVGTDDED